MVVSFHGITLKLNEMNRVGKFKLLLPCAKRIPCPPTQDSFFEQEIQAGSGLEHKVTIQFFNCVSFLQFFALFVTVCTRLLVVHCFIVLYH